MGVELGVALKLKTAVEAKTTWEMKSSYSNLQERVTVEDLYNLKTEAKRHNSAWMS